MKKKSQVFSPTIHILMSQFGGEPVILLTELSDYFKMSEATLKRRAKTQDLPVPVARLGFSQKSPYVVHIADLADHIDKKFDAARKDWNLMNAA